MPWGGGGDCTLSLAWDGASTTHVLAKNNVKRAFFKNAKIDLLLKLRFLLLDQNLDSANQTSENLCGFIFVTLFLSPYFHIVAL